MKLLFPTILITALLSLGSLCAQTSEDAPQPSRTEVEAYVKEMRTYIAGREERAARIVSQIVELDRSLQTAVGGVLRQLKAVTDSQESRTKVARIKRDVMERIERAAQYYANERAKLNEALRVTTDSFRREDLFKERAEFDARIDRMVDAVVELALSMDTHQDFEKYLYESGGDWFDDASIRKNPLYEQNRRTTSQSDAARKNVSRTIQQSLDRLKAQQVALERQLEDAKLDEARKKRVQEELERVTAIRNERIEQLYALSAPKPPPTVAMGLHDALAIEDLIEAVAADARRDMNSIFARYRELRNERDAIAAQKARLARAEKWLAEQDAKK